MSKGDPIARALDGIERDAKRARVARALPEKHRPTDFMLQIGLVPAVQSQDREIVGPSDDKADEDDDEETA